MGGTFAQISDALGDGKMTFPEGLDTFAEVRENIKYARANWAEIKAEKNDLDKEEIKKLGALALSLVLGFLEVKEENPETQNEV